MIVADLSRFLTKQTWASKHDRKDVRRHPVYRSCVIFWCFSPLYILYIGVSPVWLVLMVSALAAAVIPVLTPALMKITNDKSSDGRAQKRLVYKCNFGNDGFSGTLFYL